MRQYAYFTAASQELMAAIAHNVASKMGNCRAGHQITHTAPKMSIPLCSVSSIVTVYVSMQTCARLEGKAIDLLAVHPLLSAHARCQLEAEVAEQLRHAGVMHDFGQRLPNALPRACTDQDAWESSHQLVPSLTRGEEKFVGSHQY